MQPAMAQSPVLNGHRSPAELARSNADLQAFAHTVAHDLREPLRTIATFTQLLVRKAQLDEDQKAVAEFIVEGVNRMSTMLDDLLVSATRGAHDSLQPVELEYTAAQAMQNLREAITASRARITIEPLPVVQGRELDLVRLFQNLISNAVKYRSAADLWIRIFAERCGSEWVIKTRDNGIGIPQEHQHCVFEPFTRLHSSEIPGTGMGLAICERIVQRLGGVIWVESEPGAGSTFCFTVAAAD